MRKTEAFYENAKNYTKKILSEELKFRTPSCRRQRVYLVSDDQSILIYICERCGGSPLCAVCSTVVERPLAFVICKVALKMSKRE